MNNVKGFLSSDFGGIYFDNDAIALQSFDDMRVHELALGRETGGALSNGIMVSV